jgi:hypothetical protein
MLFQIVPVRRDDADAPLMSLFSIYLFWDATRNDEHDIQSMSTQASQLKIKESEKQKNNCFLVKPQL